MVNRLYISYKDRQHGISFELTLRRDFPSAFELCHIAPENLEEELSICKNPKTSNHHSTDMLYSFPDVDTGGVNPCLESKGTELSTTV